MGGEAYWYFVPYQRDVEQALRDLRDREFKAGRYSPATRSLPFEDLNFLNYCPGPIHRTMAEAIRDAAATGEGTRSILDIAPTGTTPALGVAEPVSRETLVDIFETDRPTHEMVKAKLSWVFSDVGRGECVYIVIYRDGEPDELLFAGCSLD